VEGRGYGEEVDCRRILLQGEEKIWYSLSGVIREVVMSEKSCKPKMLFVGLAALALCFAFENTYAGKKKGIKGRYLELEKGIHLSDYKDSLLVLEPATIVADKERAVDTESVRTSSDDMLREALTDLGMFQDIVSVVPLEIPEDRNILRMTTKLNLQFGSQAMRWFVGSGAGKSKLHMRVDMYDAKSGKHLGFYNGYGTGAGFGSISGGAIQRMARDDFQENYKKFCNLLNAKTK